MARLLSVNLGLPRDIQWKGRTVHTAIWKAPVTGRCRVSRLNLEGDGQGDLAGHGGEQRHLRLPERVLSLLADSTRKDRFSRGTIRRELLSSII
jgi:MOSC domain-containing protein YiiM